jgi:hypothetical protein
MTFYGLRGSGGQNAFTFLSTAKIRTAALTARLFLRMMRHIIPSYQSSVNNPNSPDYGLRIIPKAALQMEGGVIYNVSGGPGSNTRGSGGSP